MLGCCYDQLRLQRLAYLKKREREKAKPGEDKMINLIVIILLVFWFLLFVPGWILDE